LSSLQRLEQIKKPTSFDDTKTASEITNSEANSQNYAQFFEAMLSQLKRVVHGNQVGNWFDDPASIFGGDASLLSLYQSAGSDIETQVDLQDNNVENIVVGDITLYRKIIWNYSFELPIGDRAIVGNFVFTHDGTNVDLENDYSYVSPEITGVVFSASIVGNNMQLTVTTSGVGENPKLRYRALTIGVSV
jgi:hypothetical protein